MYLKGYTGGYLDKRYSRSTVKITVCAKHVSGPVGEVSVLIRCTFTHHAHARTPIHKYTTGIWDHGRKLLEKLDACPNWEVTTGKNGEKKRHVPSDHLKHRLKRVWDFLRLQLHLHVEPTSEIGSHCLKLKLGSLAEPRFNSVCGHHHFAAPIDRCPTVSEGCAHDGCTKASEHHCKHCETSFCIEHLADNICTAENLPAERSDDRGDKSFVCRGCSPKVECKSHKKEGCASCDEVEYFKKDIMHVARQTGVEDIIGRAENLCADIDIMVGHVARTANQVSLTVPLTYLNPSPNPYLNNEPTGTILARHAG